MHHAPAHVRTVVYAQKRPALRNGNRMTTGTFASLFGSYDPTAATHSNNRIRLSRPAVGKTASGFPKIRLEVFPDELSRLVGYDPRNLGKSRAGAIPKTLNPHVVALHESVQRTIKQSRVDAMVQYLLEGIQGGKYADWDEISLVTTALIDTSTYTENHEVFLPSSADLFISDGQHRYCAVLDLFRAHPELDRSFTQSVAISVLPQELFEEWAGQAFHDKNYLQETVKAAKALATDSRDLHNRIAKELHTHPLVQAWGGINTSVASVAAQKPDFTTHSIWFKFVRGFIEGQRGLEKGDLQGTRLTEENYDNVVEQLIAYLEMLGQAFPHLRAETNGRAEYLIRQSAALQAVAIFGHLIFRDVSPDLRRDMVLRIGENHLDWRRSNLTTWGGVLGVAKDGFIKPFTNSTAIRDTLRILKECSGYAAAHDQQPSHASLVEEALA